MKLAIDPETVNHQEIVGLVDNDFLAEISIILKLEKNNEPALIDMLIQLYDEFIFAYYEVRNSLPEHEESAALIEVEKATKALNRALNDLMVSGNADKRLAKGLERFDSLGIWKKLIYDKHNPNIDIRRLIATITVAANYAADKPEEKQCDPALLELIDHIHPNREEERRQRIAIRKIPKDLPIRKSIRILKTFFDSNVNIPFTAGKYYSEIGFKSPAFLATKKILKKIYPNISDRKIASLMQEATPEDGYNFPNKNDKKNCSTT